MYQYINVSLIRTKKTLFNKQTIHYLIEENKRFTIYFLCRQYSEEDFLAVLKLKIYLLLQFWRNIQTHILIKIVYIIYVYIYLNIMPSIFWRLNDQMMKWFCTQKQPFLSAIVILVNWHLSLQVFREKNTLENVSICEDSNAIILNVLFLVHSEKCNFSSFQIYWNMIVLTIFLWIISQAEFRLIKKI